ncbi:hypothetical protein MYP_639 [Sporocytophaga myxococcoides]|uniref:Uncharacterized protein n=1 Tax=Sporocytophaga myxococcoides TaxID=153721 RepID=A0A098LAF5_9BACT|nr:hypothetical protein [Sporocytophaga myxococcoides]GAL83412.1 hypothetical protein MYP_639 [Sporocytophaga myxococcoides]
MRRSTKYREIKVTTTQNGSISGIAWQGAGNPGLVVKWWDGVVNVVAGSGNAASKNNDGTARDFSIFINRPFTTGSLLIQGMGATVISPMNFSDFGFALINISNNKLTDISTLVLPSTCSVLVANANQLSGSLPSFPSSINNIAINSNLYTSLPSFASLNLTSLAIGGNPITSLPAFNINSITTIDFSGLTSLTGSPVLDLSSKTVGVTMQTILLYGISSAPGKFTSISLPAVNHTIVQGLRIEYNPITAINNLSLLNMPSTSNIFTANDCQLNITFPLGVSPRGIKCPTINIANNGMNSTNVNATIDNWYSGLDNFNNAVPKTLNIGGTNDAPSGTYQMPSGFSYGVSNGTPATQKEKIWVAENQTVDGSGSGGPKKYKWTVTFASGPDAEPHLLTESRGNLTTETGGLLKL